jgi:hypothetical protein
MLWLLLDIEFDCFSGIVEAFVKEGGEFISLVLG